MLRVQKASWGCWVYFGFHVEWRCAALLRRGHGAPISSVRGKVLGPNKLLGALSKSPLTLQPQKAGFRALVRPWKGWRPLEEPKSGTRKPRKPLQPLEALKTLNLKPSALQALSAWRLHSWASRSSNLPPPRLFLAALRVFFRVVLGSF